jgi:diguanylate cyclase (GGDEF)-like protein
MPLPIDPPTMFLALVASTMAAVLLLLWCFWLNRSERSLLWMAIGFVLASGANLLFAGRARLPEWAAIDIGIAVLLLGVSFIWIAARVFNGRPVELWVPAAGPALWLIACGVPAVYANLDARVVAGTVISAAYYLLAAREFALKDGLLSRFAMTVVLCIHALIVLLRIPLLLTDASEGLSAPATAWFGLATLEAAVFIQILAFLMVSLIKERVESQLRSAALTDSLTGLANRRAFFQWSEAALAQARRHARPFAAIVFDLDRFKAINDRLGHPAGDLVLETFAEAARKRVRGGDFVGRLGGEEFAVALPDATVLEACLVAEEVNHAFRIAVASLGKPGLFATASAGVAQAPATACSVEDLLSLADRALYEAKGLGGDQVCSASAARGSSKAA